MWRSKLTSFFCAGFLRENLEANKNYHFLAVKLSFKRWCDSEGLESLEAKAGKHTAKTGLFYRDYPGRLVVLPAMAATCAVIFFGGTEKEAGPGGTWRVIFCFGSFLSEPFGDHSFQFFDFCLRPFPRGVAAICGLVTGLIEYALIRVGGEATLLIDLGA